MRGSKLDAVKQKLNVNEEYTVIDCNTGKEFKLVFTGGENHAEAELASESELEAFNYICGSEYNFLKRPVVVMFGGNGSLLPQFKLSARQRFRGG